MRKFAQICGWILWSLGVIYAALGIANGDKLATLLRDSTIQKHSLWESGTIRKEEAKVALFEVSDRFAALGQRVYWTLGGLMAVGTLLIVVGRKGPNQSPQRNAGSRPSSDDSSASETPSSLGPRG